MVDYIIYRQDLSRQGARAAGSLAAQTVPPFHEQRCKEGCLPVSSDLLSDAETVVEVREEVQEGAAITSKARKSRRKSHRNRKPKSTATSSIQETMTVSSSSQGMATGAAQDGMDVGVWGGGNVGIEVNSAVKDGSDEAGADNDADEDMGDPEWSRLQLVVNQEAEQMMERNPDQPLECALLRALWNHEKEFPMDLISRYQCMVADMTAPADDDLTEAQWWCEYQPSGWD